MTEGERLIDALRGGLVVSCQPETGGPLDRDDIVLALAQAVLASGARGLRIEGVDRVRLVRDRVDAPIIGIVKRDLAAFPVRITPYIGDLLALVDAGADIVAIDATDRARPVSVADLIRYGNQAGVAMMADCATVAQALAAKDAGCAIVATTLSGYTGGAVPHEPDIAMIADLAGRGLCVMAEGRMRGPAEAEAALRAGAWAVTVGSAITRPEHVTKWFVSAMGSDGRMR